METVRKYKWFLIAAAAVAGASVAAYTIWRKRTHVIPVHQLELDIQGLDASIHTPNKILLAHQLAAIEGLALRYYYTYRKEERETRQLCRCEWLTQKNRKEYLNALVEDARFEYRTFELIYKQLCAALDLPLSVLRNSQKAYIDNKGAEYKEIFNKNLNQGQSKDSHGRTEEEAINLSKDLAQQREKKMQDLALLLADELIGKLTPQEKSEDMGSIASLMAYDAIFVMHKLTEDQVREVLCFYDVSDIAENEVIEI